MVVSKFCTYTHIHTYIQTYKHTYVHIYIHTYISTYMHTYIHNIHTYILHTYYILTYLNRLVGDANEYNDISKTNRQVDSESFCSILFRDYMENNNIQTIAYILYNTGDTH